MRHRTIMIATLLVLAIPGTASADSASYTVRPGDSLWLIANSNAVSVTDLVEANGLTLRSTIHPGDSLIIPGRRTGAETATSSVSVRPGDSLWSIASAARITLAALLASNGLTADSTIHPGRTLTIPGVSTTDRRPSSNPTRAASNAAGATTYDVVAGDGLTTIARRLRVGVTTLLEANALTMTSIIHPGQRLTIPASIAPTQSTAAGSAAGSALDRLVPVFERAAAEARVPADLLMAVAYAESRWDQAARSPSGAVGIGQLMPRTAAWVARDLMREPALDIAVATDNIRISAHLLAWLLDEAGGNQDRALAMYLQGVNGVRTNGLSATAVRYAERIAGIRARFR